MSGLLVVVVSLYTLRVATVVSNDVPSELVGQNSEPVLSFLLLTALEERSGLRVYDKIGIEPPNAHCL